MYLIQLMCDRDHIKESNVFLSLTQASDLYFGLKLQLHWDLVGLFQETQLSSLPLQPSQPPSVSYSLKYRLTSKVKNSNKFPYQICILFKKSHIFTKVMTGGFDFFKMQWSAEKVNAAENSNLIECFHVMSGQNNLLLSR